jgi:hypothetical protein
MTLIATGHAYRAFDERPYLRPRHRLALLLLADLSPADCILAPADENEMAHFAQQMGYGFAKARLVVEELQALCLVCWDQDRERILEYERQARIANYPSTMPQRQLPKGQRRRILERDEFRCVTCGSTEMLAVDHKQPRSKGGSDDDDNLQILCRSCNSRKGVRVP